MLEMLIQHSNSITAFLKLICSQIFLSFYFSRHFSNYLVTNFDYTQNLSTGYRKITIKPRQPREVQNVKLNVKVRRMVR